MPNALWLGLSIDPPSICMYKALLVYDPLQPNAIAEPKSRPNAEYIYGVIEKYNRHTYH